MNLELNKSYHGFKLIEEREINEINSLQRLFEHEKTGARLLNLQNDDDNKVFSIGFRTPPENSTGLPHILEHSVLCGSRKFPTKEPFVDLLKGSLNTFLNAMTFPDKTIYPVASRNEKDFYNLMDVYLDAVFYPSIYSTPEIFMQEGWHYELDSKEDELNYKGVVYNEMKGAFSSPEDILFRKIQESLFPNTPYSMESGGDPDIIPRLSLEEFRAFHKKYYHPSNSYIFLYGNGDILDELKFIEENYLKDFDRIQIESSIPKQKPFKEQREVKAYYPISDDENEKDNTFLNLNFVVGKSSNPELYLAFDIIEHLLLETPAAPLKKALIEGGLGKDVFGRLDNSILQPVFSIVVKNSNEEQKEQFQKIVFSTLNDLVNRGIDKKLIEASINIIEFKLREADFHGFPKGLLYHIKSMDSWLYDENPAVHLQYGPTLGKIKEALNSNYLEKLIEEFLIKNNHRSLLIVKPKKGLSEEKAKEVRDELEAYRAKLSEDDLNKIIEDTKKLKLRQVTQDSPEDQEKIPMVSLEDINPEAEKLPINEVEEGGIKILTHPMFTNKIGYINFLFDSTAVEQEMLPYLGLLAGVMGKVSTDKLSYGDLSNEINIHTGGIDYSVEAYTEKDNDETYYPKFVVKSRVLIDKMPKLFEILGEILGHTKFDDKKRLKEIIREMKSRLEMTISNRGHIVAGNHLISYFSPLGKYNEILKGLDFYKFIAGLEKNLDDRVEEIVSNLVKVSNFIFNRENLIISYTSAEEDYDSLKMNLNILINEIGDEKHQKYKYKFELSPKNEGLLNQGKVQFVAKGYNYRKIGFKYSGTLRVLSTIAGLDYLWNKVRVQGGAYGAFGRFDRNGNIFCASYRDPNIKETLEAYDGLSNYIRNFEANEREMKKYIIGTISEMDAPMTPSMKGERATGRYLSHLTFDEVQLERDEVLKTSQEAIRKHAELIDAVMKENNICTLGNEGKIKQNKNLFNTLVNVFE
ncbi:MAG: peptidase [Clostridiales bacterium]|nr:peptidase [Clostridiales bacterium]